MTTSVKQSRQRSGLNLKFNVTGLLSLMKFNGTLISLKDIVNKLDRPCRWVHKGAYEIAIFEDEVSNLKLNWWPSTGEIRLVGDPEVRDDAVKKLTQLLAEVTS